MGRIRRLRIYIATYKRNQSRNQRNRDIEVTYINGKCNEHIISPCILDILVILVLILSQPYIIKRRKKAKPNMYYSLIH